MKSPLKLTTFIGLIIAALLAHQQASAYGSAPDDILVRAVAHQSPAEFLQFVLGALGGAVLLAGAAAFLFKPRPSNTMLAGLALAGATGMIHLMMGLIWGNNWFLLNGIGYFGLGVLWTMPDEIIPQQKKLSAVALAIYTFVTILLYVVSHIGDHFDLLGIFDKAIEVLLLIAVGLTLFRPETAPR